MIISNPNRFLIESDPKESFVLRLAYWPSLSSVELVYNYAAESVSAAFEERLTGKTDEIRNVMDFRKLVFHGSSIVACLGRQWPCYGLVSEADWKSDDGMNPNAVITEISFRRIGDCYNARIRMQQYGPYEFRFSSLEVLRRRFSAIKREGADCWLYTDLETGLTSDEAIEPFPPEVEMGGGTK